MLFCKGRSGPVRSEVDGPAAWAFADFDPAEGDVGGEGFGEFVVEVFGDEFSGGVDAVEGGGFVEVA